METETQLRYAEAADVIGLAQLWHDGWWDAHGNILPNALAKLRTLENFERRLESALHEVRTIGSVGVPVGFHMIRGDELHQLYVARECRGTGIASALMRDAEAMFLAAGVNSPWLACAIGNDRAARFYEKSGWLRVGVARVEAETSQGPYPLQVWRYEKSLLTSVAQWRDQFGP